MSEITNKPLLELLEKCATHSREAKIEGGEALNGYAEGLDEVCDAIEAAWPRIQAHVRLQEHMLLCPGAQDDMRPTTFAEVMNAGKPCCERGAALEKEAQ